MVVAVNPFGDVHIAPFPGIVAQVKKLFKTEYACVLSAPRRLTFPRLGADTQANIPFQDQETPGVIENERAQVMEWESTELPLVREENLSRTAQRPDVELLKRKSPWPQDSASSVKVRTETEMTVEGAGLRPKSLLILPQESREDFATPESSSGGMPPVSTLILGSLLSGKPTDVPSEATTRSEETSRSEFNIDIHGM